MLKVDCVPAFEDNYIWLVRRPGHEHVAVVDPGDAEPVLAFLEAHQLRPEAILITHHHADHTGGIEELVERYGIPVYGPDDPRIPGITHVVHDQDELRLEGAGLRLRVLATPGHTRSHICFVGHSALFCGDTLFTAGCGRLFEGTPEQAWASLEKLRALVDNTQVYCAHEYTEANLNFALVAEPENPDIRDRLSQVQARRRQDRTTVPAQLGLEKKTNPFLRSHIATLRGAAERFAGHRLASGAEVFGAVRRWKDSLD